MPPLLGTMTYTIQMVRNPNNCLSFVQLQKVDREEEEEEGTQKSARKGKGITPVFRKETL